MNVRTYTVIEDRYPEREPMVSRGETPSEALQALIDEGEWHPYAGVVELVNVTVTPGPNTVQLALTPDGAIYYTK